MHHSLMPMLEGLGINYTYKPSANRQEILDIIADYEGLIIRSKTSIDAVFLKRATKLQFIGRAGAGLDLIDLDAVKAHKVVVFAANEGNRDAVAEHCMGMLLSLFNKINTADLEVRKKIWLREENRGVELMGKTVGIIGFGNVGQALARRLKGFGVKVLAYDRLKKKHLYKATMEQIFEEADVVSLHVPLTDETRIMVDEKFIGRFKKPIFIINSSRGEVASIETIVNGLKNGKIRGACLDVLENEKMNKLTPRQETVYDELFRMNNVILTPHVAGWTHESYIKINEVLVEKIKKLLKKN
jgi:D-3-phosphoglycerate dehydrogenase / 2-oxoglutarate reductase